VKTPGWSTILAWVTIIGTFLGIIGFFISDLPGLLGKQPEGLSEDSIVATLAALQESGNLAALQLTQIALSDQLAANQATQQALDLQREAVQATATAVQAAQEAFIATQNAIVGATATIEAQNAAGTATAEAQALEATATQEAIYAAETASALDMTATAQALALITPTATATPTPTSTPTPTPAPVAVSDHRLIILASVAGTGAARLVFTAQVAQPIPAAPRDGLAYVWLLDTDRDPSTGRLVQDIGVELLVAVRYEDGAWVGTVRTVKEEGAFGDPLYFLDITIGETSVTGAFKPSDMGVPNSFDWVARSELLEEVYPYYPEEGHLTFR
jgi:hypothetical protein